MNTTADLINWLLMGDPWVQYHTRVSLLKEPAESPAVAAARQAVVQDARIQGLLAELAGWPGKVIASHKSAGQPYHKLAFLADAGLKAGDPGMEKILPRILESQSDEGPFRLPMNVSVQHGGSGQDLWGWALCDAPILVYALACFGLEAEPAVRQAAGYLAGLIRDNGWPCVVSKELGSFRGPGRREDPCPYATLVMLKALARFDEYRSSDICRISAEALLSLWKDSLTRHPYIFHMGNDFRKLKAPFVWYDLLHVLDVLSRFEWVREDERFLDMLAVLQNKADAQGRFSAESVWTAWKGWEFAQKNEPSRWLSLLAWRIF